MDAAVQATGKKIVKALGAVCLVTGAVALSAVVFQNERKKIRKGE